MKLHHTLAPLMFIMVPASAMAQSFDSVDACKNLRQEVTAAVEESRPLAGLITDPEITEELFLAQLYEGVKVLSKTGEMFLRASDSHEFACKTALIHAGNIAEMRTVYEWYLEPAKIAYQFFRRAREAAVRLNRQADVDVFNATMTEYDAAIMKLVAVCESDLAGNRAASSCATLSVKLSEALK